MVCSSNSAFLLNASKINFTDLDLSGVRLEDTDLSGGVFLRTNFENSGLKRVKITSADFTESNLTNINWTDMHAAEVQIYTGYGSAILSVAFSCTGDRLATAGGNPYGQVGDSNIRLW